MLGVINRQELSKSIGRMEIASTIAGAAVVVGVLVEVAPDLVKSIATPRWPTLETLGAIVVAVGVSLEVVMASRIARKSELIQEAANKEIALINERAENAGRQAADANLARVKIEERLRQLSTGRKISGEARANIKAILGELTDRSVDIFLFDEHWLEGKLFADQLNSLFRESGWESKVWVCAGGRLGVGSLTIAVATEEFTPAGRIGPLQNAAGALAHALNRSGIEVTMLGEGFDRTKEVLPWHILDHSLEERQAALRHGQSNLPPETPLFTAELTLKKAPIPASVRVTRYDLSIPSNEIKVNGQIVSFATPSDKLDLTKDPFGAPITVQYHPR